jgi:hypothetical protein
MLKFSSKAHGLIDYGVVVFLWLAPSIFCLPHVTAIFTYVLGGVHLLLTSATKFELGIFRLISLNIHGLIELLVSLILLGAAFCLGSLEGDLPKKFYLSFGTAVLITWIFTDYHSYGQEN